MIIPMTHYLVCARPLRAQGNRCWEGKLCNNPPTLPPQGFIDTWIIRKTNFIKAFGKHEYLHDPLRPPIILYDLQTAHYYFLISCKNHAELIIFGKLHKSSSHNTLWALQNVLWTMRELCVMHYRVPEDTEYYLILHRIKSTGVNLSTCFFVVPCWLMLPNIEVDIISTLKQSFY